MVQGSAEASKDESKADENDGSTRFGNAGGQRLPETLAAIDIGTNSVHMLVARVASNGRFEPLTRQKEMVRLGSGQGEMKRLSTDAMDRGIEALGRCRTLADSLDAPIHAVATSAVREALNAEEFIGRASKEAGVEVEVISGLEEARLIQLGVLQALPLFDKRLLLVDVGGGSTELLIGKSGDVEYARSVKLGSLRMTARFFPDGVADKDAVKRCRKYVRGKLAVIAHDLIDSDYDVAVVTSGTAEALVTMALVNRGSQIPQKLNASMVDIDEIGGVVEQLGSCESPAERKKLPGMDAARADILLGGAIVLEEVCRMARVKQITFSSYALREGVLLDALHRASGAGLHHLSDLRRSSVFHLMELCDDDPDHSVQVARLALQLHEQLRGQLGLDDASAQLLEAGALLANVGLFISHSKHHKHSYYVIRNSEHLMGFTDRELEVVAQIARYHRRSAPSPDKHPAFAALDHDDQWVVKAASSLLRVAIGSDRDYDGSVDFVSVSDSPDGFEVALHGIPGADLTMEQYSASSNSKSLEACLGRPVEVTIA